MRAISRSLWIAVLLLAGIYAKALACSDPPVAIISTPDPIWVHINYPQCFDGWSSYDDITPPGITWHRWDFGDGSYPQWKQFGPCDCDSQCDPEDRAIHAYSDVDTYTVTLLVEDFEDQTGEDTMTGGRLKRVRE